MFFQSHSSLVQYSRQHLAIIQTDREITESQRRKHVTCGGANLCLHYHRTRTQHINVALIELAKAAARSPIGAPHRLDLITLKKLWQLVLILRHHTCKRHRQVVTQRQISLAGFFMLATLENFENELVPFFTILAQQRFNVLNRRCLKRFKPVAFIHVLDHTYDVFAFANIGGKEIAHAARWLSFSCHSTVAGLRSLVLGLGSFAFSAHCALPTGYSCLYFPT